MSAAPPFIYEQAFSRNIGWLTHFEQQCLRGKRVALAGMGGVGGNYVQTLARLGIGSFTLADFDRFELPNFNRQSGAAMSTLGQRKLDVVAAMARDINPEVQIRAFDQGVTDDLIDAFLAGADIYVDSLDFFVIELRRKIFARCQVLGIPALTAAPMGMGCAFLYFAPGGMSFEQWFRFEQTTPERRSVNFAAGLAPQAVYRSYVVDPSAANMARRALPSTGLACELCAGITGAQVLKILLGRGPLEPVPTYHHFDAYLCTWKKGWLPGGNGHPLQRIKLAFAYGMFERLSRNASTALEANGSIMERILDLARWAPSGDNMQPWRFQIEDDEHVTVLLQPTHSFYETLLNNKGTWLALGALLETLRIAASQFGRSASWELQPDGAASRVRVSLRATPGLAVDPLTPFVVTRSVLRNPFRTTPLTAAQKQRLQQTLGEEFELKWRESFAERWQASRLNMRATAIICQLRETFETHQKLFDWERDFSADRIPAKAAGASPPTQWLMRTLMRKWGWMRVVNSYLGGSLAAQFELSLLPGLLCAGHFVVRWRQPDPLNNSPESWLRAGQAMQRFWLQATAQGLVLQPSFSALIFSLYAQHPTARAPYLQQAQVLADQLKLQAGAELGDIAFLGRIGTPRHRRVETRSLRLPLSELLQSPPRAGTSSEKP